MNDVQLVYISRPFGFNEWTLNDILAKSRRCNQRDGITGTLVCRHDMYLQILEGRSAAVAAAFDRISTDDRHADIVTLWSGPTAARMFPNWAMRHDPVRPWMWSPADVAGGAPMKANPLQLRALFARLAAEPPPTSAFN